MIRSADLKDFDSVIKMMVNFANAAPVEDYHDPEFNYRSVQHFLSKVKSNGCIFVAESANEIQGMLIGQICSDPWVPEIKILKELAWWVEPQYRNSSAGYKLLKKYVEFGKELQQRGVINRFVLTNMVNSPEFDLAKRGWREIETNYVYEGAN